MLSQTLKRWGTLAVTALLAGELTRNHCPPHKLTEPAPEKISLKGATLPSRESHVHLEDPKTFYAGMPESSRNLIILTNCGFYIGYDDQRHEAAWVAYHLRAMTNVGVNIVSGKRPDRFYADTRTQSMIPGNFLDKMGYDKGHLAPSDALYVNFGATAQVESFSIPNTVPESPPMNRRVIRKIEALEQNFYANGLEDIWVFTGPNIAEKQEKLTKGGHTVPIPPSVYRIILDVERGKPRVLVLNVPQDCNPTNELSTYLGTLGAAQQRNQIRFFPKLPRDVQLMLENQRPTALWEVKKENVKKENAQKSRATTSKRR